jgi:hypothetical protein
MMLELLAPRVEDEEETDLGAEMLRVSSNGPQGLRRRPAQNAVRDGFVAVGDRRDCLGHREDDVEIRAVEDVGLTPFNPLRPRQRLALRAVAIAAGVVPDAHVLAAITLLHVPAEHGGPTLRDRGHHPPLGE